jgi:DNA replicative helicase MCM subunit Mcm2 (Cdc46/Mcm family)
MKQNLNVKNHFLEIDMAHLLAFNEQLASDLKKSPKKYMPPVDQYLNK